MAADATIRVDADTRGAERALGRLQSVLGALSVGFIATEFAKLADEATNLRNRLNLVTSSVENNNAVFNELFQIAQRSRSPLSQTGDLFFRIARSADTLGISQAQALQATENVAKAITASGISAAEAAGPLLQLGQALQSGRLQGDELRSILEGLPPVSRALAASLGVPVGALKELGAQGKISGRAVIDAILAAGETIEKDFGKTTETIEQSFTKLNNSAVKFADSFNTATGASTASSSAINRIADALDSLSKNIDLVVDGLKLAGAALLFVFRGTIFGAVTSALVFLAKNIQRLGFLFLDIRKAVTAAGAGFLAFGNYVRSQFASVISQVTGRGQALTGVFDGLMRLVFIPLQGVVRVLASVFRNFQKTAAAVTAAVVGFLDPIIDKIQAAYRYLKELLGLAGEEMPLPAPVPPPSTINTDTPTGGVVDPDAAQKAADALKAIEDGYRSIRQELLPLSSAHEDYGRKLIQIERAFAEGLFVEYDDYVRAKERLDQQYALAKIEAQNAITDQMTAFQDKEIDAIIRKHELDRAEIAKTERYRKIQIEKGLVAQGVGTKAAQDLAEKQAEYEKMSAKEKTQYVIGQAGDALSKLGQYNRQAFEAAKALNIAEALMSTYTGVANALKLPFPLNLVIGGVVLASGLAQVASIRSQQYSGRALGGPVMGGQSYIVGENGPEMFTPATSGGITRNQDLPGGNTNINFYIQTNDAKGFDQLLAERKPMIVNMIRTAQNDRGNMSKL